MQCVQDRLNGDLARLTWVIGLCFLTSGGSVKRMVVVCKRFYSIWLLAALIRKIEAVIEGRYMPVRCKIHAFV